MTTQPKLLLAYITCESVEQAQAIGRELLSRRLCACVNIYPDMQPMFFWPPKSGNIDTSHEVTLIAKTIPSKYADLEAAVTELHSFDVPCIMAIPVEQVAKPYYDWLMGELSR